MFSLCNCEHVGEFNPTDHSSGLSCVDRAIFFVLYFTICTPTQGQSFFLEYSFYISLVLVWIFCKNLETCLTFPGS